MKQSAFNTRSPEQIQRDKEIAEQVAEYEKRRMAAGNSVEDISNAKDGMEGGNTQAQAGMAGLD